MSTRISSAAALLLLAACSQDPTQAPADADDLVECALDGATEFTRDCVIEVSQADGGPIVVIRHPDGSFRRFEWIPARDGPELHEADGAERAQVEKRGDMLDVTLGTNRYRIPQARTHDVDD
jgi:hypothetical protein